MQINYMESYKTITSCVLQSLILGFFVICASEVRADGYAECNQILVQDMFNRTTNFESKSAAEKANAYASIFQLRDHEAYKEYSRQHDEAKESTEQGDGGGSFFEVIKLKGGGSVTNKQKLSEAEFFKLFNKARDEYKKETGSATSSSQNLVSNYASYTRDPGTVTAWKECVTKSKDTNLYAFASRDQAGKTSVNVIWVPGVLAGSLPSIPVKFVTDGDAEGVKIHAESEEQVAMGSGMSFAVSCGTKCDNGFQVTVNGTLKNAAGIKTNSFTSTVVVPPLKAPELTECTWGGVWVSGTENNEIPTEAVKGGHEHPPKSEDLFICRAFYGHGLHPGKFRKSFGGCNIGWGGKEYTVGVHEILIGGDYKWIAAFGGEIPSRAIVSGREHSPGLEELYICRAFYENGLHPGKVRSAFKGCHIGWGGKELEVKSYEVLVDNSKC